MTQLFAKVWYTDDDNDITGPFQLPDEYGADLLIQDMVGCGWRKIEIMDESLTVTHTITWLPNGEYEVRPWTAASPDAMRSGDAKSRMEARDKKCSSLPPNHEASECESFLTNPPVMIKPSDSLMKDLGYDG